MSRIPRFTGDPAANSTGAGQYHIELARLLHDEAFGNIWFGTGRTTLFPVGRGSTSVQPTGALIPELVPPTPGLRIPDVPPPIDRRDVPQDTTVVPQNATTTQEKIVEWVRGDDGKWRQLINGVLSAGSWSDAGLLGRTDVPQSILNTLQQPAAPTTTTSGGSMDLGDIYDVVDAAVGGVLPGGVPFGTVTPTGGVPAVTQYLTAPQPAPAPAPTGQAAMPAGCDSHNMEYKFSGGQWKWVKRRRRRSPRILTAQQAADLELLTSILGKSSAATKVWIAKRA